MHDLDSTLDISELDGADPGAGELELEADFDNELEGFGDSELEGPFDETEEMELAAELLAVSDDAELEQFLGKLFKRIKRGAKKVGRALRPLGRILKPIAKRLLPIAGRAVGTFFGGPAGGAIGGRLAPLAGKIFGLELEGLSPEDQELEVARRFVRLAGAAAQNALAAPESAPPEKVAKAAVAKAAKKHAPGLLRSGRGATLAPAGGRRSGRWIRRGRKIVLLGV